MAIWHDTMFGPGGDPEADVQGERETDPELRLQHALDLGYRYLGHRDRTVHEMRRHLASKRVEPATIDDVIATLGEQGYVDDARFAQRFTEDRRNLDAWGNDRIERRLLGLGIAPELISEVLGVRDAEDELAAAVEVLRRRFRTPPQSDRERDRALGMLIRKGYELELAYAAVRALERSET